MCTCTCTYSVQDTRTRAVGQPPTETQGEHKADLVAAAPRDANAAFPSLHEENVDVDVDRQGRGHVGGHLL